MAGILGEALAAALLGFGTGFLREKREGPERTRKLKREEEDRSLEGLIQASKLRHAAASPEELDALGPLLEKLGAPNQGSALPDVMEPRGLAPWTGTPARPLPPPQDPFARMLFERIARGRSQEDLKAGLEERRIATGEGAETTRAGGLGEKKRWNDYLMERGYPFRPSGVGGGLSFGPGQAAGLERFLYGEGRDTGQTDISEDMLTRMLGRVGGAPAGSTPEGRGAALAATADRKTRERDARVQRLQSALTGPEAKRVAVLQQQVGITARGRQGGKAGAVAERQRIQGEIDQILDAAEARGVGAAGAARYTDENLDDLLTALDEGASLGEVVDLAEKLGVPFDASPATPEAFRGRILTLMGATE